VRPTLPDSWRTVLPHTRPPTGHQPEAPAKSEKFALRAPRCRPHYTLKRACVQGTGNKWSLQNLEKGAYERGFALSSALRHARGSNMRYGAGSVTRSGVALPAVPYGISTAFGTSGRHDAVRFTRSPEDAIAVIRATIVPWGSFGYTSFPLTETSSVYRTFTSFSLSGPFRAFFLDFPFPWPLPFFSGFAAIDPPCSSGSYLPLPGARNPRHQWSPPPARPAAARSHSPGCPVMPLTAPSPASAARPRASMSEALAPASPNQHARDEGQRHQVAPAPHHLASCSADRNPVDDRVSRSQSSGFPGNSKLFWMTTQNR
jgi:hypothetical protein